MQKISLPDDSEGYEVFVFLQKCVFVCARTCVCLCECV